MWSSIVTLHDQQRLVDALRSSRYVVYDETEWPNVDGVAWMDRYPVVAHALDAEYRPVATFGSKIIYEHGSPPAPARSVAAADPLALEAFDSGWYAAEDPHNVRARWSAPHASLRLRPQHGDDALVLDYETYDTPGAGRTLTISVDDRVVGKLALAAGRHHEVLPLGSATTAPQTARVSLDTSAPLDALDLRALGVMVYGIGFGKRDSAQTAYFPAPLSAVAPAADARASFWDRGANTLHVRVAPVREARAIEFVQILVNTALTGLNACYVSVTPQSNSIFVAKDVGSDWFPPAEVGAVRRDFVNSQCRVQASRVHVRIAAGALDVTVSAVLEPAFAKRNPHAWVHVKPADSAPADWLQLHERATH